MATILAAGIAVLAALGHDMDAYPVPPALGFAWMGCVLLARRPHHPMGPLLCLIGLANAVSICRRYRLADTDADDVAQSTWLHLVGQLANIRHPAALPGWIATTAKRECLRVLRTATWPLAGSALDTEIPDQHAASADAVLLTAERQAALREALAALPPVGQQLMTEISARLGIPVGSIGPNRQRCMDKLRRYPAIAALINADAGPGRRTLQLTR